MCDNPACQASDCSIPFAQCHCGCGLSTNLSPQDHNPRGYIKGVPFLYSCGHGSRLVMSEAERFWSKVEKTEGCWLWTGKSISNGYPRAQLRGKQTTAHRIAWILTFGEIEGDKIVCHDCDIKYPAGDFTYRRCVRPDHLFVGTKAINIHDAIAKGRYNSDRRLRNIPRGSCHPLRIHPELAARGEKVGLAKLREGDVRKIRQKYATGEFSQRQLARIFRVAKSSIGAIIHGKTWSHVSC